jgi:hypothetical protein
LLLKHSDVLLIVFGLSLLISRLDQREKILSQDQQFIA